MTNPKEIAQLVGTLVRLTERLAADASQRKSFDAPAASQVLLTVEETARRLSVGRTTTFRLIGSGELVSVRIGRLRRVHVDVIDAYAASLASQVDGERAPRREGKPCQDRSDPKVLVHPTGQAASTSVKRTATGTAGSRSDVGTTENRTVATACPRTSPKSATGCGSGRTNATKGASGRRGRTGQSRSG
ncbi:excisionase family DNA-binding protein [Amycolatopsis sp. NPDC051061]|uniref:excisionase family DNA-binding protein n=1 Tax=Amycolatopsis sp. NPDC051061 TaxID=3155042 RepID=UPI00342EC413